MSLAMSSSYLIYHVVLEVDEHDNEIRLTLAQLHDALGHGSLAMQLYKEGISFYFLG